MKLSSMENCNIEMNGAFSHFSAQNQNMAMAMSISIIYRERERERGKRETNLYRSKCISKVC